MDEAFDCFGSIRFEGRPGGGPGDSIDTRDRFFGASFFGIPGSIIFSGMRFWSFGFGLMRFELPISFASRFHFACLLFGITTFS